MKTETITATCSQSHETHCLGIIEHEGKQYEVGGGFIGPDRLVAYAGKDGQLTLWDGQVIGTYQWRSSKPAVFFGHRSYISDRYYYGRAQVNGVTYAIQGHGLGMAVTGKRMKSRR